MALGTPSEQLPPAEEVATDVGPLLFPAADMVMRPFVARTGDWELDEAMLFRAHLERGMTVVDVGAHVGYYTTLAARAVGRRGRVIALEPHPTNAALLRANVSRQRLRNVQVVEAAAWKATRRLRLELNLEGNTADHWLAHGADHSEAMEVDGIALDELLAAADIGVVKVDAQGADHTALEGMERLLRRCLPVIFAEYWPFGIRRLGEDPADVIRYYRSLPFRLTMPGVQADFEAWADEKFADVAELLPGGFGTLVLRPRSTRRAASGRGIVFRPAPLILPPGASAASKKGGAGTARIVSAVVNVVSNAKHMSKRLTSARRLVLLQPRRWQRVSAAEQAKREWFSDHVGAARQIIAFLAGDEITLSGRRVVDLGCGDGIIDLALALEGRPRLLVGFDIEPVDTDSLIARAQGMGYAKRLPPELTFLQSEPERLPADDKSFDVAVTWSAFEHIANPRAVLAEVARVLDPGGVLMLQLWPFYRSEHGSHLWPWFPDEQFVQFTRTDEEVEERLCGNPEGEYMLGQYRALNRITVDELQRCLVDTGFSVQKLELISHQVRLSHGLDRSYSFADLGIAGVKLLARSEH